MAVPGVTQRETRSLVGLRPFDSTPPWLFALLATVPALSGTERGLLVPGLKLSDVIVILIVVIIALRYSIRDLRLDAAGWALLAYGLLHMLFVVINFARRADLEGSNVLDVGKEMANGIQYFVIFAVALILSARAPDISTWLATTLAIAAAIAIVAFLQEMGVPGIREVLASLTGNPRILAWEEWQDSRATGPFFSWHALGIYLSIHATLAIALLFRARLSTRQRALTGLALLALVLGLVSALTATPVALTVLAALVLAPWRTLNRRLLLGVVGTAGALGGLALVLFWNQIVDRISDQGETVIPGVPRTIAYRLLFWTRDYFPLIGKNLWTGYGPLGPNDTNLYPHTESMYVTVLMAGGIILLTSFVTFLAFALVTLVRARRAFGPGSRERAATSALVIVTCFLFAAQFIHPYFDDAGGAPLYVVTLGILMGQDLALRLPRKESNDVSIEHSPDPDQHPRTSEDGTRSGD